MDNLNLAHCTKNTVRFYLFYLLATIYRVGIYLVNDYNNFWIKVVDSAYLHNNPTAIAVGLVIVSKQ